MDRAMASTDKQIGLAIIAGLVVLAGVAAMLLAPGEELGAAGFAVAIVAGLGVIGVVHLFAE